MQLVSVRSRLSQFLAVSSSFPPPRHRGQLHALTHTQCKPRHPPPPSSARALPRMHPFSPFSPVSPVSPVSLVSPLSLLSPFSPFSPTPTPMHPQKRAQDAPKVSMWAAFARLGEAHPPAHSARHFLTAKLFTSHAADAPARWVQLPHCPLLQPESTGMVRTSSRNTTRHFLHAPSACVSSQARHSAAGDSRDSVRQARHA